MKIDCKNCGSIIDVSESIKSTLMEKEILKTSDEELKKDMNLVYNR